MQMLLPNPLYIFECILFTPTKSCIYPLFSILIELCEKGRRERIERNKNQGQKNLVDYSFVFIF
jgi:hypothetical protein